MEEVFSHSDRLPSRITRDTEDVRKLISQLTRFDVFRVYTVSENKHLSSESSKLLVSLATKDTVPENVGNHLMIAKFRGNCQMLAKGKDRLLDQKAGFHDKLLKTKPKTFDFI